MESFTNEIHDASLVVFSDFNYGCLPQSLVNELISVAKDHGALIAADSQTSSQQSDIVRFTGVDLLTPTEHEARVSIKNFEDGLVVLAEKTKNIAFRYNLL